MTLTPGQPAYPAQYDHLGGSTDRRDRRRAVLWVVAIALVPVVGALMALQVVLARDEGCNMTPPGYFNQTLVSETHHGLYNTCVLDPGNGEPRYTIHRPWQSVRGL